MCALVALTSQFAADADAEQHQRTHVLYVHVVVFIERTLFIDAWRLHAWTLHFVFEYYNSHLGS